MDASLQLTGIRTFCFGAVGYSPDAMAGDTELERDDVLARVRTRVLAAAMRRGLSPTDAEDVAQDTLLLLATKYAHVAALEELVAVGAQVARYKCAERWRKVARRHRLGDTPLPTPMDDAPDAIDAAKGDGPGPDDILCGRQRLAFLLAAAARLQGRCREILRRKLEGASFVEIAAELGRPVNTVYSWDHRCHQKLKELLGDRWAFVSGREEPS